MNYFEAISKFKKQEKMIKSFVKCFVEDDKFGRQIQELSSFLESSTDVKHIVVNQDSSLCMLVSPNHYYLASVLCSQYAISHGLSNISLVTPTGETTKNLSSVVENAKNSEILTDKMLSKIESFEERTPF